MSLITLFIVVCVIFCLAYLGFWVIGQAFPAPIQQVARIVLGVIVLLFIVGLILQITGLGDLGTVQIGHMHRLD